LKEKFKRDECNFRDKGMENVEQFRFLIKNKITSFKDGCR